MKGVYIVSSDTCNAELKKQTYKYFEDRNIEISQYPEQISSDEHFFLIIVPPEPPLNSLKYTCGKGIFTPLEQYFANSDYSQIQVVYNVYEGNLYTRELRDYTIQNKNDFKNYGIVEVEPRTCNFEENVLQDVTIEEEYEEGFQINILNKFLNYAKSGNTVSNIASSNNRRLLLLLKK